MKRYLSLFIICTVIVAFAGCSKSVKEKINGTWKVKSVEGQNLSQEELNAASITFVNDGTFKAKNIERELPGKWTISEDEKTLTLKFNEKFEEIWKIQSVSDTDFVYTTGDKPEKITLKK